MSIMNPYATNVIDPVAKSVDAASQLPCLWSRKTGFTRGNEVLHGIFVQLSCRSLVARSYVDASPKGIRVSDRIMVSCVTFSNSIQPATN